jgi:hypothetical protein
MSNLTNINCNQKKMNPLGTRNQTLDIPFPTGLKGMNTSPPDR